MRRKQDRMRWLCLGLSGALLVVAHTAGAQDAANIIGAEDQNQGCITCHALEVEAWQTTRHFATFKDRHRSDEAKKILAALGIRSMKRAEDCNQCHYTSQEAAGRVRAISGVSCESCHGAGRPWIEVHQKIGGDPGAEAIKWGTGKNQSPAERAARLDAAAAKGMLHPARLDDIARNCYGCHTVPNERVVNEGGHKAGSEFDLVAWSQGEVRHNFVSSAGAPDAASNRAASDEQRRRLYVVGAMVDLETSLRNLAAAEQAGGAFQKAMSERARAARRRVAAIIAKADFSELATALEKVPASIDASTVVDSGLLDGLAAATRSFVEQRDGPDLAALDALIPKAPRGKPHKE